MSTRGRARLIVAGWIGLCLILAVAGCQLQVSFVDPSPKPPPQPSTQMAAASRPAPGQPGSVVQTSGYAYNQVLPQPGVAAPLQPVPATPSPYPPNVAQHPHANAPPLAPPAMPHNGMAPQYGTMPAPIPTGEHGQGQGWRGDGTSPTLGQGWRGGDSPLHSNLGNGPPPGYIPTEKAKTSLPPYVIEPPDILLLDPIRLTPKPPYVVGPMDVLLIRVAEPLPNQPIEGTYVVTPDGTINLGYNYGQIMVNGLTIEEVERVIRNQLKKLLKDPQVAVGLAQYRGVQQTRGEHLVRPDGTISLGSYGCVYVAGLTLAQAKVAIERHLCAWIQDPEVAVDVFAYNSKVYYVITDGAGYGMNVYRFPVTGNETVLDAISNIQGLPAVASRKKIWVARPAPPHHGCSQILPVDWLAITEGGVTATNYQIFPGDRIYVQADALITMDNVLAKVLAPFERILGFMLLTSVTFQNLNGNNVNGGNGIGFIAPLN